MVVPLSIKECLIQPQNQIKYINTRAWNTHIFFLLILALAIVMVLLQVHQLYKKKNQYSFFTMHFDIVIREYYIIMMNELLCIYIQVYFVGRTCTHICSTSAFCAKLIMPPPLYTPLHMLQNKIMYVNPKCM